METKEIQAILLPLMKKLHTYCVEHELQYSISYGTLIGAARHKGFIPWDDDIDIVMPRESCNRLLELTKTIPIADDVGILHHTLDDDYRYNFIRVYDKNTIVSVPHARRYPKDTGLWIDIMPLDHFDTTLGVLPRHLALEVVKKVQSADLYALPGLKGLKNRIKQFLHFLFPSKNHELAKLVDHLAAGFPADKTRYLSDCCDRGTGHILLDKNAMGDLVLMDFEDIQVLGPRDYATILEREYGPGWVEPPPEDQRIPIHNIDIVKRDSEQQAKQNQDKGAQATNW